MIAKEQSELTYHMYAGPSFKKVADYMMARGWALPNPLLCVGFTAEDAEGNIHGLCVIHSVPIVEPFEVEHGYGREALGQLFEHAREFILDSQAKRVLMHTEYPLMQRMLMANGATKSDVTWFEWNREA